jgi:hypothetical protein
LPVKIEWSPAGEPATSEDLFEAIAAGDSKAAADALRRMDGLGPMDRLRLADLISGEPISANYYPYRFKLMPNRGAGRPTNYLEKKANAFLDARLLRLQLMKHPSVDAAIKNVVLQTGKSYSRLWRVYEMWIKKP